MTPGRRRAALAGIAAAALLVRLAWALRAAPEPLQGDAAQYFGYAASLRERRAFIDANGARDQRMPGYPAFVAAVQAAAGPRVRPVLLAQACVGTAAVLAVSLGAEALLGTPWGLAAGAIAALARDLAEPAAWPLSEALFAALLAGALATPTLRRAGPWTRVLATAVLWALAYATRPEVLPVAALALVSLPLAGLGLGRREAAAGVAVLTLAPLLWAARNLTALGRPLPATSNSAAIRYLGLRHPAEMLGLAASPRPLAPADELAQQSVYASAYSALRRELGPGRVTRAYAFNALAVWYPFLPTYDPWFVLLLPLWAAGLWEARRRPEWWPAAAAPLLLCAVYVLYGGPASRYRFGFAPAVVLVAALGARVLGEAFGRRRALTALGAWAGANALVWAAGPWFRSAALALKAALFRG